METILKQIRKNSGLKQSEISQIINVPIRVYQRYESGERIPIATTAILIAKALNTTVEKLFSVADDTN